MTSLIVLRFQGTVQSRGEASDHLKSPGDAVLIERGRPRWLLISCPCGCGDEFPINLDPRAGPAWRLYINQHTGVSLYPSVWRESGCGSHYIIWRNKIYLLRHFDEDFYTAQNSHDVINLLDSVYNQLPSKGFIPFSKIAEILDEIPWEVLMACRQLVKSKRALEGAGKKRGTFRQI